MSLFPSKDGNMTTKKIKKNSAHLLFILPEDPTFSTGGRTIFKLK